MMRGAAATEVKNKFGQILESAMIEPIAIEKNGRKVVVMMSMSEYQRLLEIEDRYWGELALKAIDNGFLTEHDTKTWIERKLDVKAID
ncbi:MAG TPA: type II toxin-antitoxin system Phd/YefM family antitoxin [Smithellaceae bacterium]|jgi:prevent-host-death family protein|nr:type II toxin-antitoxin system Phd/YefM family antitoxin [Smithellaceae bacterium]HOQ43297.1 type II toxin-antitoxin system Phd/YefM family antitoxin [Smithellaceae bacterium]HQP52292.1 type II toxin-antitoxin system Phd/YefM family antitoxin [Syntrophorhabdaceae bacterium]